MKNIGTIGYIANSPYTKATGTLGAGGIGCYVKKKFKVKVMFITSTKVICKVVDGIKDNYLLQDNDKSTEFKEELAF